MTSKQEQLMFAVRELQRTRAKFLEARDRVSALLREVCHDDDDERE